MKIKTNLWVGAALVPVGTQHIYQIMAIEKVNQIEQLMTEQATDDCGFFYVHVKNPLIKNLNVFKWVNIGTGVKYSKGIFSNPQEFDLFGILFDCNEEVEKIPKLFSTQQSFCKQCEIKLIPIKSFWRFKPRLFDNCEKINFWI